jgi:hypothetical protein
MGVTGCGIAHAQDVFSSGSGGGTDVFATNSGGRTGTQGVVGNPNCPQPVEPGGIRPLNWSCPTGTQAVGNNPPAQGVNQIQRGTLLGTGTQPANGTASRGALLGTAGQQVQRRQRTAGNQLMPSAGAAANQRLQAAYDRLNNSPRMGLINGAADAMGQRRLQIGPPRANNGTNFGYGAPARNSANRGYGTGQFGGFSRR